jgi:transposase
MKARSFPAASPNPPKKIDLSLALRLRIRDGLTHAQIAKRFGCTREAVTQAFKRFTDLTDDPAQLEAYRQHKQDLFEASEQVLVKRILRETQDGEPSFGELARALDVVSKQVRLLQGQSTGNLGLLVQTLKEVHADLDAALAEPAHADSSHESEVVTDNQSSI